MTPTPRAPRRRPRVAKTYTEEEAQDLIANALDHQVEKAREATVSQTVGELRTDLDEIKGKVSEGNEIKQKVLDVSLKVKDHHEDIDPMNFPDWSLEEKRALRSTVVEFLSRLKTKAFITSTWKRRAAILAAVCMVLTLLVGVAAAVVGAFRGTH
jgi:hypothetical protein